jgi:hypothetical protein
MKLDSGLPPEKHVSVLKSWVYSAHFSIRNQAYLMRTKRGISPFLRKIMPDRVEKKGFPCYCILHEKHIPVRKDLHHVR